MSVAKGHHQHAAGQTSNAVVLHAAGRFFIRHAKRIFFYVANKIGESRLHGNIYLKSFWRVPGFIDLEHLKIWPNV